jgi:hypothetical protein
MFTAVTIILAVFTVISFYKKRHQKQADLLKFTSEPEEEVKEAEVKVITDQENQEEDYERFIY